MQQHEALGAEVGVFGPIIAQAIDAVVIIDHADRIVLFNAAAERLWGLSQAEVMGRNVCMLVPESHREQHLSQLARNRGGGENHVVARTIEVPVVRPDGTRVWGAMSLSRTEIDDRFYYAAFVKDVTDEVRRREELYLLSLVANETDRAVFITDRNQKIVYCNRSFMEMFGYSRDELIGYDKGGREIWISATVNPVFDGHGKLRNAVCVISNITETRQTQVLQQRILEAVARDDDLSDVAKLICQEVEAIAPGVTCTIIRVDQEGLLRPLAGPSLPPAYGEAIEGLPIGPAVGSCGTAAWRGEPVLVKDIETDPLWAPYKDLPLPLGLKACWSSPIKLKDGRVAGTFAFYFREKRGPSTWHERLVEACVHLCALAIERHEAKAHIARLAYFDTLTGLPNRTRLTEHVEEAIARVGAGQTSSLALLFLDVDSFKDVNDSLGHSAGDALLIEIARRLKEHAGPRDVVSRLGGDEFVMVLENLDADQAAGVAERVVRHLAAPVELEHMTLSASASIGISLLPGDSADREELLKHADTAMYEAKNAGRGSYRFFGPQMNRQVQERLVMSAALKESLCLGQLALRYQPQIRGEDGSLHGVEALARWTHPRFGEVPPGKFIALAEETGLIEAIGEWAISEACRQMAAWRMRGVAIPTVSVNLSPLHFRNPRLPELVTMALESSGLSADALTLEITEGVMMDACAGTRATVEAVAQLGVRLSLDDFGTGYSSLSSISTLPIEEIKLDRSFVRDLQNDKNARAVASAVIRIGHSLGLTVVAEGVETEPQQRFLQALECHVMQGFLFAPALTAPDLERWLSERDVRQSRIADVA
ncbi:MAG: hypothetical protein FD152_3877 [Xanthobacteraceae bacterium]|nr:MAG: hypothetical protein FD152_3877 [Xanthobacteraceae bacterium]